MQVQPNQAASQPNVQQKEQDQDLLNCVALTHDLMETTLGKKWLEALENWYMVRMGAVDPRAQNWEAWGAFREGQNSLIRQLRQWVKEHKVAMQVKTMNAEKPKVKRTRAKK